MQVFFEKREELAPNIWQYHFKPERPVQFVPGQYADFHVLSDLADPRGRARTFTLTSLPGEGLVSFVVKFGTPLSAYKQALHALQAGDVMQMDDPMGDLVLPKSPAVPLVYVAGGIGIASYVSMLQSLLAAREERRIFLFYALRNRNERIFADITSKYPLEIDQRTIAPHRLQATDIIGSVPEDSLFYLSGSQTFVEGLFKDLLELGAQREQVVFDYYEGYSTL